MILGYPHFRKPTYVLYSFHWFPIGSSIRGARSSLCAPVTLCCIPVVIVHPYFFLVSFYSWQTTSQVISQDIQKYLYIYISISLSHVDDQQVSFFLPLKIGLEMSATVLCCPHFRDRFQHLRGQLDEAIADHRHGNDLAASGWAAAWHTIVPDIPSGRIYIYIYSIDMYIYIYMYILRFYLGSYLASYLASSLTFYLASILTYICSDILSGSLSGSLSLSDIYSDILSGILSGMCLGPGALHCILRLQSVRVQVCSAASGAGRGGRRGGRRGGGLEPLLKSRGGEQQKSG